MRRLASGAVRRTFFPRAADIRLSPIKEMELRAARIPGVVSLAQGIPSFDTPEPIRAYVREKIADGACSRYSLTPGLPKLREAIAEALLREGMRYDPESEIIVCCGSIEAISATLLAALEPGDEVIVPSPSYASYPEAIRMAGGVPRYVPLREEENFALDTDEIERAIHRRTKAILYANPNNPSGTIYSRTQIERLAALAERHDLLLISDEVYKDFVYTDEELFSAARVEALHENVVRVFSFSKAYGMTGWRIGFLHSDRRNVAEILKVHDALVTCAPVVSQYAAIAALDLADGAIDGFRRAFRERRNRTLEHLDALSAVLDYQKPNGSYFVFPRVKDVVPWARDSRRLALDLLERARVAVVPGVAFGPTGEAHLRISYSRSVEDVDEAFHRLRGYFAALEPRDAIGPVRTPAAAADRAPAAAPVRGAVRGAAVELLDFLSRAYLARVRPKCIAIAGLQGKTVVKRWLRDLFAPTLRVRANPRSYNTDVGLPLAVLGCAIDGPRVVDAARAVGRAVARGLFGSEALDLLVVEMGIRRCGDAAQCLRAVAPDVLVVTPIAPSFSNDLGFLHTVEREISALARAVAQRGGVVIACGDDPRVVAAVRDVAAVRWIRRDQVSDEAGRLRVDAAGRRWEVGLDVVGDSALYALLAGVEAADALGVAEAAVRTFLRGPSGVTCPGSAAPASPASR